MNADEVGIIILVLIPLGLLFWYMLKRQEANARARLARADAINRLIDKFSSAEEVTDFLESEHGRKFLGDPSGIAPSQRNRGLRFLQVGVIALVTGIALLIGAVRLGAQTDPKFIYQAMNLYVLGMLGTCIGAGLLLVSFLTNLLVRRWGLNGKARDGQD